jgi:hypothetical protein
MRQERRNQRHVFGLALALGAGGLLVAVAALATALYSVHHGPVGSRPAVIVGLHFTYPTLNTAEALLLALAALGAAVVTIGVKATWRQLHAYRSFIARMRVVASLDSHPTVRVIADPRPQAFCAGYLRPAIYVSQRTVDLLTTDELEAVIAHEHHHRRVRDPLRFTCVRVLSRSLFFVPALRPLCDRYADLAELSADDAAIQANPGQKAALASALLAFEANSDPEIAGISPERVDSLLGQPVPWRLPSRLMTASLGALSGLSWLTWRASETAAAHATLNLPILSSQPCLAILSLLPIGGCVVMIGRRRGRRRDGRRSWRLAIPL